MGVGMGGRSWRAMGYERAFGHDEGAEDKGGLFVGGLMDGGEYKRGRARWVNSRIRMLI